MKRLVRRDYLPAIESYASEIASNINNVESIVGEGKAKGQRKRFQQICDGAKEIHQLCDELHVMHHKTRDIKDAQAKADAYTNNVIPLMKKLRHQVDEIEIITKRNNWPCPTYNEILFYS